MANPHASLEKIVAWAKRRGFVFPASDIYGGLANTYDYGPYGTQLKENLKNLWWKRYIQNRDDIFGIDSTIILRPEIWEASGHTASFADVMVEDKNTHKRYRADHLIEEKLEKMDDNKLEDLIQLYRASIDKERGYTDGFKTGSEEQIPQEMLSEVQLTIEEAGLRRRKVDGLSPNRMSILIEILKIKSPDGGAELTEPKRFNQLFQTEVGIVAGEKNKVYLRGEIAQGLFMNFKNILDSMHPKLPFGIGQAGKAFRNEITPGKFTFRTLEFDLMEFEYFFDPNKTNWEELFEVWKKDMWEFALSLGLKEENIRWRAHEDFERSHYSSRTEDVEYDFPWGFKEMWGLAYRSDFDLKNHSEKSGKDLTFGYPDGSKVTPHVVEPTFGLSRLVTIMIFDAYTEEQVGENIRTVLKFHPSIAPVQVAVFPLQKDEALATQAQDVYKSLQKDFRTEYDNAGNIGKMYRRQDEIGTPFCVTIDYGTANDQAVTVRERDSMKQERVKIVELGKYLQERL